MKPEYLSDGSINFALLRLYDYEQRQGQTLRTISLSWPPASVKKSRLNKKRGLRQADAN